MMFALHSFMFNEARLHFFRIIAQVQRLSTYDFFQSNMDKMIDCAKELCPYITSADVSKE